MPSLTPKIIGGLTYYYARYCQRVDGKPKIVRQVYLGKIDDLVAAAEHAQQPPQPLETEVAAFGDTAAVFDRTGLMMFMRGQLGKPVPSPVVLGQVSEKFRKSVKRLAGRDRVPIYQFRHKEREDDE